MDLDNLTRTRHRDNSHTYVAESEALDQISKVAEAHLAARRKARYEARNIRMREMEKKQKAEMESETINNVSGLKSPPPTLPATATTATGIPLVAVPQTKTTSPLFNSNSNIANNHHDGVRLREGRRGGGTGGPSDPRSGTYSSRRSSTDSSEDGFNINVRDLKNEKKELEEKFRKAMVANAGLDNEKSQLIYQVELLKDQMEETEEQHAIVNKELREKNREFQLLKRSHAETQRAVQLLQAQLDEQTRLLSERGMVLVGNEDEEISCEEQDRANANGYFDHELKPEDDQDKRTRAIVSSETASILNGLGKGPLDVRIRRLANERDDLMDSVRRLKLDLEEERQRGARLEKEGGGGRGVEGAGSEGGEWESKQVVDDYKFKLQKSEQDINTLQTNVARLESQVLRYKTASETAERSEEELKTERRKMQRELREATSRVDELETTNKHLETRLGKLKTAKSALLKDL